MRKFYSSRAGMAQNQINDKIKQNFVSSLVKMIVETPVFGAAEASLLNDELVKSPYSDDGMTAILAAIDARVANATTKPLQSIHTAGTSTGQLLKHWWNYLTEADWSALEDQSKSWHSKQMVLISRSNALGCTYLHEQSFKWLLALLLSCHYGHGKIPPPLSIYNKLQDLKDAVLTERMPYPHEHIPEYPEFPAELPKHMHDYAYQTDQPAPRKITVINSIAEQIPLRKNSKLLRASQSSINSSPRHRRTGTNSIKDESSIKHATSPIKKELIVGGGTLRVGSPIKRELNVTTKEEPQGVSKQQQILIEAPQDPKEESLLATYKSDVWEHRQMLKSSIVKKEDEPVNQGDVEESGDNRIKIQRGADGRLVLTPRISMPLAVPVQTEVKQDKVDTDVKDSPSDDSDLDIHSQAALKALRDRNIQKKVQALEDRKLAAAERKLTAQKKPAANKLPPTKAEAGAKQAPAVPMIQKVKKSKMCMKVKKCMKKAKPAIKDIIKAGGDSPATATAKAAATPSSSVVPKNKIHAAMPADTGDNSNPAPVLYCRGVVYTEQANRCFRGLKIKGNKNTGITASWGSIRTKQEAWDKVVAGIYADSLLDK